MGIGLIFKKITANGRSVAFDGKNYAPIITGDINAPLSIDGRSFKSQKYSIEAEFFANTVAENQLPYLWAVRNCFRVLRDAATLKKLKVKVNQSPDTVIITLIEFHKTHSDEFIQLKIFFYENKGVRKVRWNKAFRDIFQTIVNISKQEKMDFCKDRVHIVYSPSLNSDARAYVENAKKGEIKGRFFRSSIDKATGLPIASLDKFLPHIKVLDAKNEYGSSEFKLNNSYEHDCNGSVNEVFQALAATFIELEKRSNSTVFDSHEIEMRLGVTNVSELFPASPVFDPLPEHAERSNHGLLLKSILEQVENIIIHAPGGVGKTVTARLFCQQMPVGSHGVVYDCFGSGQYRTISRPRHTADKVLVQIINELVVEGLCPPLIADLQDNDKMFKKFVTCIEYAVSLLRTRVDKAQLIIFIDAADNAEMAAKEHAEKSIVKRLLNDFDIEGCKIIALCRTERIELLEPRNEVVKYELSPFSESESYDHLLLHYPSAKESDGLEFHRLSGGNPRVQATGIDICKGSLTEMLAKLGPTLTTVDDQIEQQLDRVIKELKKRHIKSEGKQIERICTGLASLPPFIPLHVLARISGLPETAIRSFVSDLGRPLLIFDDAVQFRDEPTETWFRKRFLATQVQACSFLDLLKPFALHDSYVAESLPHLMLSAGRYDDLIEIALSESALPLDNPIDARSIRVSRLQYALRAALANDNYADSIKLSLRNGEELASDDRQLELLLENVGLIGEIQSSSELQKMAFQGKLSGSWLGSNNLYTASLLSSAAEYKGEARTYFRAATKWLSHYFDSRKQSDETDDFDEREKLEIKEISVFFLTVHNLLGEEETIQYIKSWYPEEQMHGSIKIFADCLLDRCDFAALHSLLELSSGSPHISLHFVKVLHLVGQEISGDILNECMESLLLNDENSKRINKSIPNENIFSFIECSLVVGIDANVLIQLFDKYIKVEAKPWFGSSYSHDNERSNFLKASALRSVVSGQVIDIDDLLPEKLRVKNGQYEDKDDKEKFRQVIGALLPYYILITKLRSGQQIDFLSEFESADKSAIAATSRRNISNDDLPNDVATLKMSCLLYVKDISNEQKSIEIKSFISKGTQYKQNDALQHVYVAYRLPQASYVAENIENFCYQRIRNYKDVGPEAVANDYISLAKSVLPISKEQASKYFDEAVISVSKIGDEALSRFMGILALAEKSGDAPPELVYRFSRCTEIMGEDIREKHFPRAEALNAVHMMHSPSAFAVLARWLDREVIYLGRVQPSLLQAAVELETLTPGEAWASTGFIDWYPYIEFTEICLTKETDASIREYIFDEAAKEILLKDLGLNQLTKLHKIGVAFDLSCELLDEAIDELKSNLSVNGEIEKISTIGSSFDKQDIEINWSEIFEGVSHVSASAIMRSLALFDKLDNRASKSNFWDEFFSKFTSINGPELIDAILECDFYEEYELHFALEHVPAIWMTRPVVREKWLNAFEIFSERNVLRVCNPWWLKHSANAFPLKEGIEEYLVSGIIKGFKNQATFFDSESLFSMISTLSKRINSEDARSCLDYALARFELNVDTDDADGDWSAWLMPPDSTSDSYALFLWSALANPSAEIRWQATHCVHKLVSLKCKKIINSLFDNYCLEEIGAFGSNRFPFYFLHARLYFLIGLYRGAQEATENLVIHGSHLLKIAKHSSHAFIEYLAAEVALKIASNSSSIFTDEELSELRSIGSSPFSKIKVAKIDGKSKTPFHENNNVDTSLDLYLFSDYQQYWLAPLARIFNVSSKQLHQLSNQIIIKEWGVTSNDKYIEEARQYLWRHSDRESYSRYTDIPEVEPYDFYLGYHAMYTIASRLLKEMPVVEDSNGWEEDEWKSWFYRNFLSRHDGYWLADRRDPSPLKRRSWIFEEKSTDWQWEITKNDFLEGVFLNKSDDTYICVHGSWKDHDGIGNEEAYHITSAMASEGSSLSLITALSTSSDSYDFKLPDYKEESFEIEMIDFNLKGWIVNPDNNKRLDNSDPHTGGVNYPTRDLNPEVIKHLKLTYDNEKRKYKDTDGKLIAFNELWSESSGDDKNREMLVRYGNRLYVSLKELLVLCEHEKSCLIISVRLGRRKAYNHYDRDESHEIKYPREYFNLYCLTTDGSLRDSTESHQLR